MNSKINVGNSIGGIQYFINLQFACLVKFFNNIITYWLMLVCKVQ